MNDRRRLKSCLQSSSSEQLHIAFVFLPENSGQLQRTSCLWSSARPFDFWLFSRVVNSSPTPDRPLCQPWIYSPVCIPLPDFLLCSPVCSRFPSSWCCFCVFLFSLPDPGLWIFANSLPGLFAFFWTTYPCVTFGPSIKTFWFELCLASCECLCVWVFVSTEVVTVQSGYDRLNRDPPATSFQASRSS